jgi:hypothetical protein
MGNILDNAGNGQYDSAFNSRGIVRRIRLCVKPGDPNNFIGGLMGVFNWTN